MSDLSSPAWMLFAIAGTLYGLLIAYYAFSLGRFHEWIRDNRERFNRWRAQGRARTHEFGPPSVDDVLSFADGDLDVYRNRKILTEATLGASAFFLVIVGLVVVQLAGPISTEQWNLVIEGGSLGFLGFVPLLLVVATRNERRSARRQLHGRPDVISSGAADIWPDDPDRITEFRRRWDERRR